MSWDTWSSRGAVLRETLRLESPAQMIRCPWGRPYTVTMRSGNTYLIDPGTMILINSYAQESGLGRGCRGIYSREVFEGKYALWFYGVFETASGLYRD